jgi:hypothetical protein
MAASAEALLLFVSVEGDAAAVSGAGPPSEGRDWRGRNDGHIMRIRTLTETMRLSRNELFDLAALITTMLTHYPEHSPDRFVADTNLRNIRKELLRRKWSP